MLRAGVAAGDGRCKHVTPRRIIPPYLRAACAGLAWPVVVVAAGTDMHAGLRSAAHRRRLRYACVGRCGSGTTDPAALLL
jgi:hypothetical protein